MLPFEHQCHSSCSHRLSWCSNQATRVLLATNWMQESGQKQGDEVVERYKLVTALREDWEKGWFHLAKYHDFRLKTSTQHMDSPATPDSLLVQARYICSAVDSYCQSVKRGHRYIFESLPRALTLYFDYGAHVRSARGCSWHVVAAGSHLTRWLGECRRVNSS